MNENIITCVKYHPNFITNPTELYEKFLYNFDFKDRVVKLNNNKEYKLTRATCVFGDPDILDVPPKIWGSDNSIKQWTPELLEIKNKIEELTGNKYNICLCNYYKNGKKIINWHSDNEELGSTSCIASISLGADRIFQLREKTGSDKIYDYILENGSLFLMLDGCQENYLHRVPKDPNCQNGRINLTFRQFDKKRYETS
ncbi:2OG-FeII oxygenase superfamily protein [Klosneuvirus KNV1]|uniref:2OG-FeII oxygenase superfamily protein n=1 Tax=Klosneuvirus KNV1 TaxID=1977640 RepID=A0A1V0SJ11_9VIRU|nr:2OG-FeII oxygenase superfamily protein [Klosneuvirus KNV1]